MEHSTFISEMSHTNCYSRFIMIMTICSHDLSWFQWIVLNWFQTSQGCCICTSCIYFAIQTIKRTVYTTQSSLYLTYSCCIISRCSSRYIMDLVTSIIPAISRQGYSLTRICRARSTSNSYTITISHSCITSCICSCYICNRDGVFKRNVKYFTICSCI